MDLPEIPSDPREAFDQGYAAGMAFAAYCARQCGLDVDLTNPFEVMAAANKRSEP